MGRGDFFPRAGPRADFSALEVLERLQLVWGEAWRWQTSADTVAPGGAASAARSSSDTNTSAAAGSVSGSAAGACAATRGEAQAGRRGVPSVRKGGRWRKIPGASGAVRRRRSGESTVPGAASSGASGDGSLRPPAPEQLANTLLARPQQHRCVVGRQGAAIARGWESPQ